ncbi:MAG: diguanylate cyclase [Gallionella sp.]|nr:diguanylate cyclase [Gallionella sp.]
MVDPAELQAKLKALSDSYAAQLPEKLSQIAHAWGQLPKDRWDDGGFQTLHRMVHSLTGSGKTFGFALLSDVARNLEEYLKQLAQAKTVPDEEQRKRIQVLLSELHQVTLHRDAAADDQSGLIAVAPAKQDIASTKRIFVVEDEPEQAEELKIQLGYFGYDVSVFNKLADFQQAMQATSDVVVLMDINFPENSRGGILATKEIQQKRDVPAPVVFLTSNVELDARLEAVRAGGIAYLSKPVNIGNLIDKLDSLTSTLPSAPYRVLIVDDSEALTTYYATVLEQAGMVVKAVNNPLHVMEPLLEFTPDLILLDIYMPECNGMELASVIRQLDAFVGIPIVFLSAESDLDKQLFAMGLGADDFLTKPIQPQHLISSVSSRIQRSLILRSFMVRDSLTGLLNHTAIKDQLDREVAQTKRRGMPLAFAMVDIDHFKKVNDTYGHPAGDRVIKSLSRMLKQRLRETDMVGRYGGEEFAVILSNTNGETALKVLDAIRKDFARLRHLAEGKEFSATFSCGIADVSFFGDSVKLCDAADKALYKAKHAGRNQVVLGHAPPVSGSDFV